MTGWPGEVTRRRIARFLRPSASARPPRPTAGLLLFYASPLTDYVGLALFALAAAAHVLRVHAALAPALL